MKGKAEYTRDNIGQLFPMLEMVQLFSLAEIDRIVGDCAPIVSKHTSEYMFTDWGDVRSDLKEHEKIIANIDGCTTVVFSSKATLGIPIYLSDRFTCARSKPYGMDIIELVNCDGLQEELNEIGRYIEGNLNAVAHNSKPNGGVF